MSGDGTPHCGPLIGECLRKENHRPCDSKGKISDGPYGVSGFPGDEHRWNSLAEWYEPHVKAWSQQATPQTTLWFWNTEVGWAMVHPLLIKHGWEYRCCNIWDKGMSHVAGNANTQTSIPAATRAMWSGSRSAACVLAPSCRTVLGGNMSPRRSCPSSTWPQRNGWHSHDSGRRGMVQTQITRQGWLGSTPAGRRAEIRGWRAGGSLAVASSNPATPLFFPRRSVSCTIRWTPLARDRTIVLDTTMRARVVYLRTGEYRSWSKSRQVLKLVLTRDRKWEQLRSWSLRRK